MTIKELEERTGMPRANIRFYEDEGLLKPRRLANGYRDYSEEDVLTLERIKLLRQLQLDIGTIRMVQEGTLHLEQAMFAQLNKLEGDRVLIERAAEVCRAIERSGVEYGALEPQAWLKELETPARGQLPPKEAPPKPTELQLHHWSHRAYHPWMRLFARGVDMGIYNLLFHAVFFWGLRCYELTEIPLLLDILLSIGSLAFTFLLEPLWLHFVGWTPGKWIFGLKLRDQNGEKLSLSQAWNRGWRVAWEGYGWNIPILDLWKHWKGYKCCRDNEECPWDAEEGFIYTREERRLYGLLWLAEELVVICLLAAVTFAAFLPVNTGKLTVKEFAENYNDRLKLYEVGDSYSRLLSDGNWEPKQEQPSGTSITKIKTDAGWIDITGKILVGDEWITETGATHWRDPVYTVEDGQVTAVTFTMESDRNVVDAGYLRERFGLLAFSGSAEGVNLFAYKPDSWTADWQEMLSKQNLWGNFSFVYRGICVTQSVEMTGYELLGQGNVLFSATGEDNFCTRTMTFSLAGSEDS